jgi:hypothetical protein
MLNLRYNNVEYQHLNMKREPDKIMKKIMPFARDVST